MRVINKNDRISIFIIDKDSIDRDNINDYMKGLILKLKRKYKKDICGFYIGHVYSYKFGILVELVKEDDLDFFGDMLDLKIIIHDDEDVFLRFDDYFLLNNKCIYVFKSKYYVNIRDISYSEFLGICEFCEFVFGEELEGFKGSLKKVLC